MSNPFDNNDFVGLPGFVVPLMNAFNNNDNEVGISMVEFGEPSMASEETVDDLLTMVQNTHVTSNTNSSMIQASNVNPQIFVSQDLTTVGSLALGTLNNNFNVRFAPPQKFPISVEVPQPRITSGPVYHRVALDETKTIEQLMKENPVVWERVISEKKKKGIYRCTHCGDKYSTLLFLVRHIDEANVRRFRPERCPIDYCPWRYIGLPRKAELRRHTESIHGFVLPKCESSKSTLIVDHQAHLFSGNNKVAHFNQSQPLRENHSTTLPGPIVDFLETPIGSPVSSPAPSPFSDFASPSRLSDASSTSWDYPNQIEDFIFTNEDLINSVRDNDILGDISSESSSSSSSAPATLNQNKDTSNRRDSFYCDIAPFLCEKKFPRRDSLKRHIKLCHDNPQSRFNKSLRKKFNRKNNRKQDVRSRKYK